VFVECREHALQFEGDRLFNRECFSNGAREPTISTCRQQPGLALDVHWAIRGRRLLAIAL